MRELRAGDYVWYRGEGWIYLGMDGDGGINFYRPTECDCFGSIEFETMYPADDVDDYDQFCRDNGESLTESCRRKGIEVPK